MHTCPQVIPGPPPVPHTGGPVVSNCAATVYVNKINVALEGAITVCTGAGNLPDPVISGSKTVFAEGRGVARLGDPTSHGGQITSGSQDVFTGG